MARLHTRNRRRLRRYGPHSRLEQRMASYGDGAAVIARVRAKALPERLCVGLANIHGRGRGPDRLQAIYTMPSGRHVFVMADGITYSAPKRWRAS